MAEKDVSIERLKELLRYEPETGKLYWIAGHCRKIRPGAEAGKSGTNYLKVAVDKTQLKVHRVAWVLAHGRWPPHYLDHIDGNRKNNILSNLREATRSENGQNQRRPSRRNKCGSLGVSYHNNPAAKNPWIAQIAINGEKKYLGSFATEADASKAYLAAKVELHPFQTIV